jgi:guanylate kinase
MPASRLVLLSGPSCVGKGPLVAAIDEFFPDIHYNGVPVIKSKESRDGKPRPDEVDIWDNPAYFRTAEEILALGPPRYLVGDCRGHPQAIDLDKIASAETDLVLLEVYHTIGAQLSRLEDALYGVDKVSVFLSPLSEQEIRRVRNSGIDLTEGISNLMMRKLEQRSQFQGKSMLDEKVISDNARRAATAYSELQNAHRYTHVLVNHWGEGNPNWNRTPDGRFESIPEGPALFVVEAFAQILRTGRSDYAEYWKPDTI